MRFITLAFLSICAISAHAQQCETVVALSKVVSTVVSDKDSVDQHASNFCNEYARSSGRSSSSSFGASYKFLSASFGSSSVSIDEVASKYCSASNNYSATRDAYKQYIEAISPNAYSAYEQCLRMTKQDLRFNVNLASVLPTQFSMSVAFTSSVKNSINAKLAYSASDGIKCKWDTSETRSVSMASGSSAILDCSRPDQTKRGYITVVRGDATSSDPLTLPWQAYSKDGVPVDAMASLQKTITGLQGDLASVSNNLLQVKNRKLECQVAEAQSAVTRGPSVEAVIPLNLRGDYFVTGGGCEIPAFYGHNPPILVSRPTQTGWYCAAGDPPFIPLNIAVKARAIYCRLSGL